MPVHLSLLISTTCQRLSLGTFLCCFIATKFMGVTLPMNIIALVSLFFLGIGGIASMFHLGRPIRFFNAFSNLGSHVTQEAFITPFLGIALLACGVDGSLIHLGAATGLVYWLAAILSLLFLISTGLVYQLSARPAWNSFLGPVIFLLTAAEVGTITTIAIVLGFGAAVPVALAVLAFFAFALCLIFQFLYTARLKSVGYGVDVFVCREPFKATYTLWLIFGLAALAITLIAAVALQSAVAAYAGVICTVVGIFFWTMLFYKVALKVKMFPMYSVDLNLNM